MKSHAHCIDAMTGTQQVIASNVTKGPVSV